MRSIFEIYAANKNAFEGKYTTLSLPATDYEMLDVLDRTRVQDFGELYVQIDEYQFFPKIELFLKGSLDLRELNALAKKLSELNEGQSISFEGLLNMEVEKQGQFDIPRLIDLAYSADCCHVEPGAMDDAALGRFYAENGFVPEVESLTDEVFELLDFQRIGRERRVGEGGVFTRGGYVVQHTELVEAYKDMDLTIKAPDYMILLELSKGHFNDPAYDNEKTALLPLPAEPETMDVALDAIEAWDWREVGIRCLDCRVPSLISHIADEDSIAHINRLAEHLQALENKEVIKLKAVLDATEDYSVLGATHIACNLDDYLLSPQYASPSDMAQEALVAAMGESGASKLCQYVRLHCYGEELLEREDRALTKYGLISRKDGQCLNTASEPKPTMQNGMEMM